MAENENPESPCLYYYKFGQVLIQVYPRLTIIQSLSKSEQKNIIHYSGNSVAKFSKVASNLDYLFIALDEPPSLIVMNIAVSIKNDLNYTVIEKNTDLLQNQLIDSIIVIPQQTTRKSNKIYFILKDTYKRMIYMKMIQYNAQKKNQYDPIHRQFSIKHCSDLLRSNNRFILKFTMSCPQTFFMILSTNQQNQFSLCKIKRENNEITYLKSKQNISNQLQKVMQFSDILDISDSQQTFCLLVYNPQNSKYNQNDFGNQGCLQIIIFQQKRMLTKQQRAIINFSDYFTNNNIISLKQLPLSKQKPLNDIISISVISKKFNNILFYCVVFKFDCSQQKSFSSCCYMISQNIQNQEIYEFKFYDDEEPCIHTLQSLTINGRLVFRISYLCHKGLKIGFKQICFNKSSVIDSQNQNNQIVDSVKIQKALVTAKNLQTQKYKNNNLTKKFVNQTKQVRQQTHQVSFGRSPNPPIRQFTKLNEYHQKSAKTQGLIAPVLLQHLQAHDQQNIAEKNSDNKDNKICKQTDELQVPQNLTSIVSFGTPNQKSSQPLRNVNIMSFGKAQIKTTITSKTQTQHQMPNIPEEKEIKSPSFKQSTHKEKEVKKEQKKLQLIKSPQKFSANLLPIISRICKRQYNEVQEKKDRFRWHYSDEKIEHLTSQLETINLHHSLFQDLYSADLINMLTRIQLSRSQCFTEELLKMMQEKTKQYSQLRSFYEKWRKIWDSKGQESQQQKLKKRINKNSRIKVYYPSSTEKLVAYVQDLNKYIGYLQYRLVKKRQQIEQKLRKQEQDQIQEDFLVIRSKNNCQNLQQIPPMKQRNGKQKNSEILQKYKRIGKQIGSKTDFQKEKVQKKINKFPIFHVQSCQYQTQPKIKLQSLQFL